MNMHVNVHGRENMFPSGVSRGTVAVLRDGK